MSFESIESIFKAFQSLKVLIIGDVMIDAYTWGVVERISAEAPIPIVQVTKREQRLGGAANVALNVKALGATPILCGTIGDDITGENFCALMRYTSMPVTGLYKCPKRPTTIKERVLAGTQHMLRIDEEVVWPLDSLEEKMLWERIQQYLPHVDVIIFEDYDKGVLTPPLIKTVIQEARKRNIPVAADPKKTNFFAYEQVTLFKPNLKELEIGLGLVVKAETDSLTKAVSGLRDQLKIETALITLSEKGAYIENSHEKHLIPAYVRKVADVSGAGDTVVSIAALCLALNLPIKLMAALGNLGGGLVCEDMGIKPVNKAQLLKKALEENIL